MKIIIFFLLTALPLNAQWLWGLGYQVKSSVPDKGFALYLINKLPFQFPAAGLNIKGKFNYLSSEETTLTDTILISGNFREFSAGMNMEGNFFTGLFQPFVSLGFGGGYIYSGDHEKFFGMLSAQTGIKFALTFQPFVEIEIRRIFPGNFSLNNKEIKSLQLSGVLGIIINL